MVSIVEVLGLQESNPLPSVYIKDISQAIAALVSCLQTSLTESTITFVVYLIQPVNASNAQVIKRSL